MQTSTKVALVVVSVIIVIGGGYATYKYIQKKKAKKEGLDVKTFKQVKQTATKLGKEVSPNSTIRAKDFFDKDELMDIAKDRVQQSKGTMAKGKMEQETRPKT